MNADKTGAKPPNAAERAGRRKENLRLSAAALASLRREARTNSVIRAELRRAGIDPDG